MASFDLRRCSIPTVYCGKGNVPRYSNDPLVRYVATGTAYECWRKGIGQGMYMEKEKTLPVNSLQRIRYIGEKYEFAFKNAGIKDTKILITRTKKMTQSGIAALLRGILKRKDGVIDTRAYNSVLVFLYRAGVLSLPGCIRV